MLSVFALLAFLILVGLGAWQVQRLRWKEGMLADLEAVRTQPALQFAEALRDRDPEFKRVTTDCGESDGRDDLLYDLEDGRIVWRVVSWCTIQGFGYRVDRGVLLSAIGAVRVPAGYVAPPIGRITGVLRWEDGRFDRLATGSVETVAGASEVAGPELYIAVEREEPPALGIRPTPLPTQISNNHLGYAVTWFGLAAALVGVYAAMLRRPRVAA